MRALSWSQLQDEDDCALMQQLVAGNDDALAVIVDRYQRLVLSVALRIVKDVSEAEEVAQTIPGISVSLGGDPEFREWNTSSELPQGSYAARFSTFDPVCKMI